MGVNICGRHDFGVRSKESVFDTPSDSVFGGPLSPQKSVPCRINLLRDPKVDLVTEETRQRLDEMLFKIVADRSNFSTFANQILQSQKARKWNEQEVCECIRKLVKRGAQGAYADDDNYGVVMHALKRGHNVIVKHILAEHPILVKPEELNADNMNILMVALYYKRVNDENLIQLIRNFDLDHSIEDKRHRNTMVHALNANRYSVAVEIAQKGGADIIKDLREACEADDVTIAKKYFNQGLQMQCDVDANGTTLGCYAARSGAGDVLKFLIRLRTNFGKDVEGYSALHHAAMFTNSRALEVLLTDTRINVNEQSKKGKTALLIAASEGSLESVKALLNAGADTDIVDDTKCSPLMTAASKNYVEICNIFVKRGCNTEFKDINGSTAFDIATQNGFNDVVNCSTAVE